MEKQVTSIQRKIKKKGYSFFSPLSDQEIRTFEIRHNIKLPLAYRTFLSVVGNGGDGPPIGGLMGLGEVPKDLHPDIKKAWDSLAHIRKPFPFTEAWVWEGEEYDEAKRETAQFGNLNLGHDGCGMYWLLIVTGHERGKVWCYTDVGICPQQPQRDFLQWVEAWLDGVWWWPE